MKRLLLLLAQAIFLALVLLLLASLVVDAGFEAHGIPDWAANQVSAALADQGVSLQADTMRAGLTRGIVMEQAQIRLDYRGMPISLSCRELHIRLLLRELLRGRIRVREVGLQDAQATISFAVDAAKAGERRSLRLERCNGVARRGRSGAVIVSLDGVAEKVAVRLEAELRNPGSVRLGPGAALTGWTAEQPGGLQAMLTRLSDAIATCGLSEGDAFIRGRLEVDLAQPDSLTFEGTAGISDLRFGNLLIDRCRSELHYRESRVRIEKLDLGLGSGQALTGSLALDLASRRVSGRVSGRVLPETLWALFPASMPPWLERVTVLTPIEVSVELAPSPLVPSQWQLKAEARAVNVALPGIALSRVAASATWNSGELAVDRWRIDLDPAGTEYAEGALRWYASDSTLGGNVTVRCNPADRPRLAGIASLGRALNDTEFTSPLLITAELERSPLDWRRLRLHGDLGVEGVRIHGCDLAPVKGRLRLSDGLLSVEPLTVGLPDGPEDALTVTATADVAEAITSGTWKVAGSLSAKAVMGPAEPGATAGAPAPPPWGEALVLRGTVLSTPLTGALDVTAEGTAYPDLLYATLAPRAGLPDSPTVQRLHCAQGSPVAMALHVTRADRRQSPRLTASVHATGFRYNDLILETIDGRIELSRDALEFPGIRATTQAGEQLSLDLRIALEPLAVTISNGRIVGHPGVVASFIDDPSAKAAYLAVWGDFRCTGDGPATIDLRRLAYLRKPGTQDWALTVDADLKASKLAYRGLPIDQLDANVLLNLPASATLRNVRVQTGSALVEGQCNLSFAGDPRCTFELRHVEGGLDPLSILGTINPAWAPVAGAPTVSPQSAVDCTGSFYLSSHPMLQLDGTLRTPYFEYRGLRVNDPVVDWHLRQSEVYWNVQTGELFGGKVAMTGLYDVGTRKGTLACRAEGVDFGRLGPVCGLPMGVGAEPGVLAADAQVEFLRGWGGREARVFGNGHLSLTQADLWSVPLFGPLGRMLDVSLMNLVTGGRASRLGRITRLDADLGFNGDRLVVPVLSTDGTVVSLTGQGEYCWETDDIHSVVNGKLLDNAGVLRLLFRPLAWVLFSAELTGTLRNNKWRLSTAVSKLRGRNDSGRSPSSAPELSVPLPLLDP